jgi:hypothetical protein
VEIEYPAIVDPSAPGQAFNQQVGVLVEGMADEFRERMAQTDGDPALRSNASSLQIDYEVGLASARLISVRLEVDEYVVGAAHPRHETVSFTFDLQAGRRLALSDLFTEGSDHLGVISNYCVEALSERPDLGDPDWIRRGAAPTADNYRTWVVTPEGIEVTFQTYQVAPYVEGPQTVVVPYREIRRVVGPQSPIWTLLRGD